MGMSDTMLSRGENVYYEWNFFPAVEPKEADMPGNKRKVEDSNDE